jgi:hypothetical protein
MKRGVPKGAIAWLLHGVFDSWVDWLLSCAGTIRERLGYQPGDWSDDDGQRHGNGESSARLLD